MFQDATSLQLLTKIPIIQKKKTATPQKDAVTVVILWGGG